ncbi:MAG: thioesterase family protein [Parachlamydiales bacterium]|jgi:1,4-dihydroxy-2-naphthoyl-CoA hydrolase
MYIAKNQVRMHDTDMAGILYFARLFRFAHDALEDFFESEKLDLRHMFDHEPFVFVIRHVEGDYLAQLHVGDVLEIHVVVGELGNSSFSLHYNIYRKKNELVGTVKTVHVCIDRNTRQKMALTEKLKGILIKHQRNTHV